MCELLISISGALNCWGKLGLERDITGRIHQDKADFTMHTGKTDLLFWPKSLSCVLVNLTHMSWIENINVPMFDEFDLTASLLADPFHSYISPLPHHIFSKTLNLIHLSCLGTFCCWKYELYWKQSISRRQLERSFDKAPFSP